MADMSNPESSPSPAPATSSPAPVLPWILVGLAMLLISGAVGYFSFVPEVEPPPPGVAGDPFLMEGRAVFLSRCVPCHGPSGRGDGPMASGFAGAQVGDLTDGEWKHGDKPGDVLRVIRAGVPGTRMAPWGPLLEDAQIRAVAGYCYALSRLPVPDELREAEPN